MITRMTSFTSIEVGKQPTVLCVYLQVSLKPLQSVHTIRCQLIDSNHHTVYHCLQQLQVSKIMLWWNVCEVLLQYKSIFIEMSFTLCLYTRTIIAYFLMSKSILEVRTCYFEYCFIVMSFTSHLFAFVVRVKLLGWKE